MLTFLVRQFAQVKPRLARPPRSGGIVVTAKQYLLGGVQVEGADGKVCGQDLQ
jgi:hypothetical protein